MTPMDTIKIAVRIPLLIPSKQASKIRLSVITLDCMSVAPVNLPINHATQDTQIRTPIDADAANDGVTPLINR